MAAINNMGNINPILPQNLGDVQPGKNAAPKPDEAASQGVSDRVVISKQAKAISKAVIAMNELPDVRADLVEQAKQQRLVEGVRVPAGQIAAKLLIEDNLK